MFDKYSYQLKFRILLAVFCFLSIAAYKRSFSSVIALINENRELSEKTSGSRENFSSVQQLTADLKAIDTMIGQEGVSKEKTQQAIVDFVSRHGVGVSINNLEAIHRFSDESHTVYTNQLDITGRFNDLIALSYLFEKEFTYSKLVNIEYYTVKKNNIPNVLHLKMIFQNYENN